MASIATDTARGSNAGGLLKDAGLTALLAALIALPFLALRTVDRPGGLTLETRWDQFFWVVALMFVGRLGLGLVRAGYALPVLIASLAVAIGSWVWYELLPGEVVFIIALTGSLVLVVRSAITLSTGARTVERKQRDLALDSVAAQIQRYGRYLAPLVLVFVIALPFLPFADRRIIDVSILILTYVMLGWGLNIIVGLAGLLDLGYVAFYAVGAYAYALLAQYFGLSFWATLPLAAILAAGAGFLLGFPVLRLRGDYFAIVTLGFGEIIRIVLINWVDFTGGPNGVLGIPDPSFFGFEFTRRPDEGQTAFHELFGIEFNRLHQIIFLYYVILALALLVNIVSIRVRKLPLGRAWEALREDDVACQALGINRTNIKLAAFMLSAAFGGLAGSFFATRQGFISPESFTFIESAIILAIVVLGGMGSQVGIALAAVLLIGVPELLREALGDFGHYRMLFFGAGMVAIMVFRPRGLLAHREPSVRLHGRDGPMVTTEARGG